ncbi:MAG TPA: phosphomannose isomerase type II C-terminal cupin domain [Candidatus Paceibacterota bacterium]|nr:phosphomannose isomerase type II C-terminal cupin domain [Candidatus Paceibacterota bacterium]
MNPLSHREHEDRPWGSFDRFTLNEQSTVKIVRVDAGMRLSLQKHKHRSEFWRVIEGMGTAIVDQQERVIVPGDEVVIPVGATHRLIGGPKGVTVLEIAFGEFDENDIERIEDDFDRSSPV